MREPNFFVVGAPKAGTTSLYYYLDQHPDIYMSPMKEPCYFSEEIRSEYFAPKMKKKGLQIERRSHEYVCGPMDEKISGGIVREWSDYTRLFAAATTQRAVGEASVIYLMSKSAAGAIASRFPHARIIVVLRSPVDRAFSQYLHYISLGLVTKSFREHVRSCLRHGGEGLGIHQPFLEMGFYAEPLQRYLNLFPRERIGIWIYEEIKGQPIEFMKQVFEFLRVDSTFIPDMSKRYHVPQIARMVKSNHVLRRLGLWQMFSHMTPAPIRSAVRKTVYRPAGSMTMKPEDKALMLEFYRNDIHQLENILDRELPGWLN